MKEKSNGQSIFHRWLLDNKIVSAMFMILLFLIIVFMIHKVAFIFDPVAEFFSAVGAPIIIAGVFYFLLNPMVDWAERRFNFPRIVTISIQFIVLAVLIIWGLAVFIPWMSSQIISLVNEWPTYWHKIVTMINHFTSNKQFNAVNKWFNTTNSEISTWLKDYSAEYAKKGLHGVSSVVGTVTSVVIAIITFPFVLFYLLKDGHQMPAYIAKFLPVKARRSFLEMLKEISTQISNYIRGQISVAFAVMIMFAIGYTIIGLPYGWLIAIVAGILNIIPFLGSFLAMVPAVVVGIFVSPVMLISVLVVFMIEQTLEGRIISPKLLGSSMKIHPVTVLIVLLSAGNIFGILGVIFGVPGYAILKVLIYRFYNWWQTSSDLFKETDQN
ncbi:AI-2E family transporter [Weissella paramesenteroides]|uniref:AI-2E family transporter n=1 Tax=Weissella paramesenteroides TaxID=1249 RepID=UPI00123B6C2C|nr:AI-2E family transporter [Weissella paramesenteroides]KAA8457435.1 AI-2E family transporter [Weissella paramesenteroides]KAA8458898.1 AI-2E family transporter [Weissella paramesenteroides]KAA8460574.1 AI-2E family transporter [Weissella paramesenteroides]KAA8460883.1 AI-2E family transporter [Weissella paramesenteroides]KAA8462636.1 AI-2E family transporter [Weissella paramesenteroides]